MLNQFTDIEKIACTMLYSEIAMWPDENPFAFWAKHVMSDASVEETAERPTVKTLWEVRDPAWLEDRAVAVWRLAMAIVFYRRRNRMDAYESDLGVMVVQSSLSVAIVEYHKGMLNALAAAEEREYL